MRELVYLSTAKLRQFQPQSSRFGFLRRFREAEDRGPMGIGSKVVLSEEVASRRPELVKVLQYIDSSNRAPRWYQDSETGDNLDPSSAVAPALLFWDAPAPESADVTHLLLHGSPEHLLSSATVEPSATQAMMLTNSTAGGIARILQLMGADRSDDEYRWQLPKLFAKLRREVPDDFGVWMAGYARVTAKVPLYRRTDSSIDLIASPLYVELISAPEANE